MSPTFEGALFACRWIHLSCAIFLWGAFGFLVAATPASLAKSTGQRLSGLRLVAVIGLVLAVVATLPVKSAQIVGNWDQALDFHLLMKVLDATTVGTAWVAMAAATLLVVSSQFLPGRLRMSMTSVSAALVLASSALTGHAMMYEGPTRHLQQIDTIIHVLSAGAWVGALFPLFIILGTGSDASSIVLKRLVVDRFSKAGRIAVILMLITGIADTWLIVGGWPLHWSHPYQLLLSVKIVVVALMIAMASTNHWRYTPRFDSTPTEAAVAIRRGAAVEIVLGITAVALVAFFGMLNPGMMAH